MILNRFAVSGMCALVVVLLVGLLPKEAEAQCADYPEFLRWERGSGSLDILLASSLALDGLHAFVTGSSGLDVVTIQADPMVSSTVEMESAADVALRGGLAYVALGVVGLKIVDVSDPSLPEVVGQLGAVGSWEAVSVAGDFAYVARNGVGGGVVVLDVSDPGTPQSVGFAPTGGSAAVDIEVSGSVAYLANGGVGLSVVDVSNPLLPHLITTVPTVGTATGLSVSGSIVYVAAGDAGLFVLDVSNPQSPDVLGSVQTPGHAWSVAASGSSVYVGTDEGTCVIHANDPAEPVVVGRVGAWSTAVDVAVSGTQLFQLDLSGRIDVFDLGSEVSVPVLGHLDAQALSVAGYQDIAIVTQGAAGVSIVDISAPENPHEVDTVSLAGDAWRVWVDGAVAYVMAGGSGLHVLDLSEPTAVSEIGSLPLAAESASLATAGAVVYTTTVGVLDGEPSRMFAVDVSDPTAPAFLGSVNIPGVALDVATEGTHAYVGTDSDLFVVDVSDPTMPDIVTTVDAVRGPVFVADGYVYTSSAGGLTILDVGNPAAPQVLASSPHQGGLTDVAVVGDVAYGVSSLDGLAVFDVSDPHAPFLLGASYAGGGLRFLDVHEGRVLATASPGFWGLSILPTQCGGGVPTLVQRFRVTVDLGEVQVEWMSGTADAEFRAEVEHAGERRTLRSTLVEDGGQGRTFRARYQARARGEHALLLYAREPGDDWTLVESRTVDVSAWGTAPRLRAAPNPFNPSTLLGVSLPEAGVVDLHVFDVAGRRVRTLIGGKTMPRGSHEILWDGRDDDGRLLASGVYVIRMDTEGRSLARRVTLLK